MDTLLSVHEKVSFGEVSALLTVTQPVPAELEFEFRGA